MLTVEEMAVDARDHAHKASRYGIATGCFAVTPATTRTTVCLSIPATTHREKRKAVKLSERRLVNQVVAQSTQEVQCEA